MRCYIPSQYSSRIASNYQFSIHYCHCYPLFECLLITVPSYSSLEFSTNAFLNQVFIINTISVSRSTIPVTITSCSLRFPVSLQIPIDNPSGNTAYYSGALSIYTWAHCKSTPVVISRSYPFTRGSKFNV